MDELISRYWQDLVGRTTGPLTFRLIVQPLVAAFFGLRAGLRDARQGSPAFGWHLFTTKQGNRRQLIRDAWKDIGKLFLAAVIIDVVYEIYVFRWVYPGQALIVATILAMPSYIAARGLTNRIMRRIRSDRDV
jgi:hypothetical protein